MEPHLDRNAVLYLSRYIPLSGLMMMSVTNKGIRDSLSSRDVLGVLRNKYGDPHASTIQELYHNHKRRDLMEAIEADDANLVVFILSGADVKYIPAVLSAAAIYKSEKVFAAVRPMMIRELTEILDTDELDDQVQLYLEDVTYYVLRSNNAAIYESYLSALSECNAGYAEGLLLEAVEGPDNIELAMYLPYAHVLMGGDDSDYEVLRGYIDHEPGESMKDGYAYTHSFDFLVWLVTSGGYSPNALIGLCDHNHDEYLRGILSYDEVKEIENIDLKKTLQHLAEQMIK